jgi:hypothetical protein
VNGEFGQEVEHTEDLKAASRSAAESRRSANRNSLSPGFRFFRLGFRLASVLVDKEPMAGGGASQPMGENAK